MFANMMGYENQDTLISQERETLAVLVPKLILTEALAPLSGPIST